MFVLWKRLIFIVRESHQFGVCATMIVRLCTVQGFSVE